MRQEGFDGVVVITKGTREGDRVPVSWRLLSTNDGLIHETQVLIPNGETWCLKTINASSEELPSPDAYVVVQIAERKLTDRSVSSIHSKMPLRPMEDFGSDDIVKNGEKLEVTVRPMAVVTDEVQFSLHLEVEATDSQLR